MPTNISWATDVWNPLTGCTPISAGCANCYAARMAKRLRTMGRPEYQNAVDDAGRWTGKITLVPERLEQPLRWRKPRRVFVNSMSDLFHESVPFNYIARLFMVMRQAHQHTFLVLSKRAKRMRMFLDVWLPGAETIMNLTLGTQSPAPNIWIGVSVENQKAADERVPQLIQTPAAIRFLSCEPLLGPVDIGKAIFGGDGVLEDGANAISHIDGFGYGVDWVIAGGESGPGYRPMDMVWVRSLRDQCCEGGVPFFFKQQAAYRSEQAPYIVELDGSHAEYRRMPRGSEQ